MGLVERRGGIMGCRFTSGSKSRWNLCGAKRSRTTINVKKDPKEQPLWTLNKNSLSRLPDDLVMLDNMNEAGLFTPCANGSGWTKYTLGLVPAKVS